jgi:acetaldehyde dehydrogenase (acetylating)
MRDLDPDLRALQEMRDAVRRAKAACKAISSYTQAETDRLCEAMVQAGVSAAADLARLAVEETGIGRVHYKILKNLFGSEGTWASIKDEKTVGVISRDERKGLVEVATASGVIAGIVPTTNPTSTALFKALVSVKGRNAIVISPHPRARRCIGETVEVLRRAIERAGGPPDLVIALSNPTIESTGALMKHRDIAIILATGGEGLVHAAYSSGRPAYGVGPGNVPLYVDRSADPKEVARMVVASQSFDNATFCCSEQALVLDAPVADRTLKELQARGAYLCDEGETQLLGRYCNKGGMMNADVVGQDPWKIARAAGFEVPVDTTILLAHQGGVGKDWPLSIEILCPVLSVHLVEGWEDGCKTCWDILKFGGLGHTMGIHCRDQEVLDRFFLEKPANRIIVNGPTSQGAVGYSTSLDPSVSLGCGPQAGNITSDNITARHLINIKRAAAPTNDWEERAVRDHARAAALGGEAAPRGSGLPGDPALGGNVRPAVAGAPATPAWSGNATHQSVKKHVPPTPPADRPKVQAAAKVTPRTAPVFTQPGASAAQAPRPAAAPAPARPAAAPQRPVQAAPQAPQAAATRTASNPYAGGSLSSGDIQRIISGSGSGCPLGPCQGCPHHSLTTGACTA